MNITKLRIITVVLLPVIVPFVLILAVLDIIDYIKREYR